jgi:5-methylcytosine-specific restriction endonuclease McrA
MIDSKCPLCGRHLGSKNLDKHHLIPKVKGGKHTTPVLMHQCCHRCIHAVFNEWELLHYYNTFDKILEHKDIKKFVEWVQKKPPEFNDSFKEAKRRK